VSVPDRPLDTNERTTSGALLRIILEVFKHELARFQRIEEGKPCCEWLVAAYLENLPRIELEVELDEWEDPITK
jgi:hypothetical protein